MTRGISSADSSLRRGTVATLVALSLPVLIGVSALTLDGGLLWSNDGKPQTMAEAISMAAAYQLYLNSSNTSGATAAATAMASQLGLTSPTINIPPTSGFFATKTGYAQVSVTISSPRVLSAIWGAGSNSVVASAVSGSSPYSTAAILVLNPSGNSVKLSGTASINAKNGNFIVDSTASTAIASSGTPGPSITAPVLDLSGKISYSGTNPNNATVTNTGQTSTPDPLSGLAAPSSSGMTNYGSVNLTGSTATLSPGLYTGITASGSSAITLSPGVYYINGGGISMTGSSSLSGSGVFIYNAGSGEINLSGTGGVSLSPMTSGTYAGISIFQASTNTAGATLSGAGNINNTGTLYFPDATLTLSGSSGTNVMGSQIIAKNLTVSGTAKIDVSYGTSVAGPGLAIVQ